MLLLLKNNTPKLYHVSPAAIIQRYRNIFGLISITSHLHYSLHNLVRAFQVLHGALAREGGRVSGAEVRRPSVVKLPP